jgi:general secretion pathway protein M
MNVPTLAGRSAALAILLGIIAAAWLLAVQPLIVSFFEHRESIGRSWDMLARYKGLASTRSQLDSSLEKLHAAQKTEDRLLTGGSAQLVGAKLQNSLKEVIESNGSALTSMQILPAREEEGFKRVSISVSLTATIESLQQILYAIENRNPYLFIENLEVRTNRGSFQRGGEEDSRNLQVHFDVYGYMATQKG